MDLVRRTEGLSEATLGRLIRISGIALVVALGLFSVFYYLDQRVTAGPSLTERQIEAAENAVVQSPNEVNPRLQLAGVYRQDGRIDDALAQYDEILKAEPEHRAALLGQGILLATMGEDDLAEESLRKITSASAGGEFAPVDEQLESAQYQLGVILLRRGATDEAIASLRAALAINRTDADALFSLGQALLQRGSGKKAVEALSAAVALVPQGWTEPYAALAQAAESIGRSDEAAYASAMVDVTQNRLPEAESRLLTLTGSSVAASAMTGLGMVAEVRGDGDAAQDWYRQAVAKDPRNQTASAALARLTQVTLPTGHGTADEGKG
ncbi:MAG: tetratricopeptide repeat protein [Candidatus Nanopelagicales bacterium]|nr:tetratricopeptide repeat protein [Candidatus Nanopelagicales bacterium]MDZ4250130.1 tetratricopeptide repeat protein [Candidatus Nanopelagicales bacterium]